MKTPSQKPIRRGEGAVIRFTMAEIDALVPELEGLEGQAIDRLRERLGKVRSDAETERREYEADRAMRHPLAAERLAMRGWSLVTKKDDTVELHVRNGDFLRDEEHGTVGWRYGMHGAFGDGKDVVRDAWQACIFSRRRGTWIMVDGGPGSHEERITAGTAALKEAKGLLRKGVHGTRIELQSFADTVKGFDHHHYDVSSSQHNGLGHRGSTKRIGQAGMCGLDLVRGVAIIKIVRGYFETTVNGRLYPTYDVPTLVDPDSYSHEGRTGPFWCEMGPAFSVTSRSNPASYVFGADSRRTNRGTANFPVFATRDEAIAYAATLPYSSLDVPMPDVTPRPLPTFTDLAEAETFSWAA